VHRLQLKQLFTPVGVQHCQGDTGFHIAQCTGADEFLPTAIRRPQVSFDDVRRIGIDRGAQNSRFWPISVPAGLSSL
jgi:hypothetical protein